MTHLVLFLEELSAKVMLEGLLPRLLPEGITFQCVPFQGKQDLEKQLPLKLRAWLAPDSLFVVMRDKDAEDCLEVKKRLVDICQKAQKPETLVRIACHELESWYLGDLEAVAKAFEKPAIAKHQGKTKFRTPDILGNPAQELEKLTSQEYQKVSGSRKIGQVLRLEENHNKSISFNMFVTGVQNLVGSVKEAT